MYDFGCFTGRVLTHASQNSLQGRVVLWRVEGGGLFLGRLSKEGFLNC